MNKIKIKSFVVVIILIMIFINMLGCGLAINKSDSKKSGIAVTSLAICEILDKLGIENVVAVPETEGTIPDRYKDIATIGAPMNPDFEILKNINPEVVLVPKTLENGLSASFNSVNLNVKYLDLSSVESFYNEIEFLGKEFEKNDKAEELISEYVSYLENYTDEHKFEEKSSVLILMAYPDGFYLVSTEDSYVGNLVKISGGENVYGSGYVTDGTGIVSISPEDMIQKNPDKILIFAHYSEDAAFSYMKKQFEKESSWQYYDAVKNNQIYYLPTEYFGMSANFRWQNAISYLTPILYG